MSEGNLSTSLQPAYILHYTQWQESSFIVDAFTLAHGRVALVARGARKSQPRVRALYQPFRPLLLSWVGGSDLRTLTGIEETGLPHELQNTALACGYYLNELILRLLGKDQPQPVIFAHYAVALAELALNAEAGMPAMESTLRIFELQLLDCLGILPDLAWATPDGSQVEPDCEYRYHPANAIAIPGNRPLESADSLGIQKEKARMGAGDSRNPGLHADGMTPDEGIPVSGHTLLALANLELHDNEVLVEARRLMRAILRVHLGDRPLKSRELFETLARH